MISIEMLRRIKVGKAKKAVIFSNRSVDEAEVTEKPSHKLLSFIKFGEHVRHSLRDYVK